MKFLGYLWIQMGEQVFAPRVESFLWEIRIFEVFPCREKCLMIKFNTEQRN